jgi:molecular chaperone DnaK (HSP70)
MDYLPENLRDDGEVLKTRIERNTDVPMRMKQELKTASSIKQSLSQSNEIQEREIANGNKRYAELTRDERISVNKQVASRIPEKWVEYTADRQNAHIGTVSLIDATRRQVMKELGLWLI